MVQPRRGLRLAAEPLQRPGVVRDLVGQDLQRHAAAQADLLGLVDPAHAAPADLAEDPVVPHTPRPAPDREPGGRLRVEIDVHREVLLDQHQRRQQPANLLGQLGVAGGVLGDAGILPGPITREERFGDAFEGIAIERWLGWLAHGPDPDASPRKAVRIFSSRSSALVYRLLAALNDSPRAAAASPFVICS